MAHRVFILDDDLDIREFLTMILEFEGYETMTASTSKEADRIASYDPHVILLDIRLHGSDKTGLSICQDLKANPGTAHFLSF